MSHARLAENVVGHLFNNDVSLEDLYKSLTSNGKNFSYDVNATTVRGYLTALHAASARGNATAVRVLLKMGANPNQKDSQDETPLFKALVGGNLECVKLLVENGARLDHEYDNHSKQTYLAYALEYCKIPEVKTYILSQLDRLKLRVPEDYTSLPYHDLHQAMEDFSAALGKRDFSTANNLFEKFPLDINLQGIFMNLYELHFMPAISGGDLEMVKFFVERGSNVTGGGDYGIKTLFPDRARRYGHEDVAAYLESVQQKRYEILKAELALVQKSASSPTLFKPVQPGHGSPKSIPAAQQSTLNPM